MKMPPKEYYTYSSWCHKRNIIIYPLPSNSGVYKIEMNDNGTIKTGSLTYRDKPSKGGISIWDKIAEMYKEIYEKNNSQ